MSRRTAYRVLKRVDEDAAYSNIALDHELESSGMSPEDKGLATELTYGTLTWRRALDCILDDIVHGGVSRLQDDVLRVLRIGAYQLVFLDKIPPHAAVDESVKLADEVQSGRARGLINAVLRTLVERVEEAGEEGLKWWDERDRERKPVRYLGERFSLPNWITNRLLQLYDADKAERLAAAFATRPPYYVRLLTEGAVEGMKAGETPVAGVEHAVCIERMTPPVREGLRDGQLVVQDLGAQLVAELAGTGEGTSVLDGCAGLGGKTLTLAQLKGPEARVLAVDSAAQKLDRLRSTARSAGLADRIETAPSELQAYAETADEQFDVVMVDAPCSALGVMRRHPEIRWNRREADIPGLVKLQAELLESAATLVRPGGTLVYAVCTFMREEGPKQVTKLLEARDDFERAGMPEEVAGDEDDETGGRVDWPRFLDEQGDLYTDPDEDDADMFYAARLRRHA